ncbi:MAG: PRC-barrel domain-containing protein [Hyphomicrobiaceae bacterium]
MKRISIVALALCVAHPVSAQGVRPDLAAIAVLPPNHVTAKGLIGTKIVNPANETLGDVNDLVVGPDNSVIAIVAGVGGFLDVGEKNVAIPMGLVQRQPQPDGTEKVLVQIDRQSLATAPKFDNRAPTLRQRFDNAVGAAQQKLSEGAEQTRESAEALREKARQSMEAMQEKAREQAEHLRQRYHQSMEAMRQRYHDARQSMGWQQPPHQPMQGPPQPYQGQGYGYPQQPGPGFAPQGYGPVQPQQQMPQAQMPMPHGPTGYAPGYGGQPYPYAPQPGYSGYPQPGFPQGSQGPQVPAAGTPAAGGVQTN